MSRHPFLKPRYEQMYLALRERIQNGEYKPGDRIPSEKELMDEFEVSRITSKKALDMLAGEGLILRQPGRGSFVLERKNGAAESVAATDEKSGRFGRADSTVIGLIMEDFADSYGKEMLAEMERTAQERGVYLMLRLSFSQSDVEEQAIQMLRAFGVDGFIIYPTRGKHFSPEILKLVIDQFPHVLVDRYLKGTATTAIGTDHTEAARIGTEHLLDLGHRHIGLLATKVTDNAAVEERIEGFVQAHAERGVLLDRAHWVTDLLGGADEETPKGPDNVERIRRLLSDNPHITALFALEYDLALSAKEAADQLGRQIPQQISILCFDSPRHSSALYPFTHLLQDERRLGRLAVDSVLDLIRGAPVPSKISLKAELVQGKSTGPARATNAPSAGFGSLP
ncbi:GntR family transcriptional regulator [Cohnella sp. CFH 77786]|uniref:GntR family transcriptional regulator n=1 Tax=Cohnella sp. CFH 77786 TaxID=2662265 RepID=UPI001C609B1B|nr:GntR family transcriptional regulator [Cohnella sp. CFH 77786]MBW5445640.1 GntR family transcriptional regulator [Cohnella sp. CFH 77786]